MKAPAPVRALSHFGQIGSRVVATRRLGCASGAYAMPELR